MRPLIVAATIAACVVHAAYADDCCTGWQYLPLPSAKKMPEAWDSYEEVEHKTEGDYGRASVCASRIDLVRRFPVRDKNHPVM